MVRLQNTDQWSMRKQLRNTDTASAAVPIKLYISGHRKYNDPDPGYYPPLTVINLPDLQGDNSYINNFSGHSD